MDHLSFNNKIKPVLYNYYTEYTIKHFTNTLF